MLERFEEFYADINEIIVAHKFVISSGGGCYYEDGRKVYGIVYAIEGSAKMHMADGSCTEIKAGQIAFFPASTAYTLSVDDIYVHYTVNFSLNRENCSGNILKKLIESDRMTIMTPQNKDIYENIFAQLCNAWKDKQLGFRMTAAMYTYELLREFVCENIILGIDSASYQKVLPAKEYLDKNYRKPVTLDELSDMCFMSKSNFRRTFLKVFGETPFSYRDKVIILHAKDYLLGNICSVNEVAEKCGFDDANYFSRFFKKHTGVSPVRFRKMN